jgi:DNA helicase HerA-like ATPase
MSDEELDEELEKFGIENSEKPAPFDKPIPEEDEYLGHIVARETGLKIGRENDSVYCVIQPNEREKVEIGDYVRVPYYRPDLDDEEVEVNRQLLASVQSLSYSTQLEDRQFTSADSFGAEQYRYIAELSPIAEIKLSDDESSFRGNFVSRPPRPTVKMDKVNENEFLRCGLDVPKDGIYVGDIAVNGERVPSADDPLEYYLFNPNHTDGNESDGEPVIFRHILVAGSTGTGKTHTSKNILRQLAKCKEYTIDVPAEEKEDVGVNQRTRGLNMTIIDPEDEYTEMGEDPEGENFEDARELAESRKGLEYGGIGEDTDFEIFAPTTRDSSTKELNTGTNEVTDFGIPFKIVKDHPQLMMPDNPQGPTRQLILKVINDYFREEDPKYKYEKFETWFNSHKMQFLLEGDKYNDSIVNAAARRLTDREEYSAVFDESSNDFTDDELTDSMFAPNKVSVLTTGHLRGATQNLVVQALSSYIVESKISSNPANTRIKGTPMILALDEAHEYLQEPETTREHFIVGKFRRAARRGRKDKFGLYFITQNPADLDGEVRNQVNTKIYLQLDRKVVDESNVYVPPAFKKQLPEFDKGQMVVVQPDVNPVEVLGLPTCLTKHTK